jgi:hypothetical protein
MMNSVCGHEFVKGSGVLAAGLPTDELVPPLMHCYRIGTTQFTINKMHLLVHSAVMYPCFMKVTKHALDRLLLEIDNVGLQVCTCINIT